MPNITKTEIYALALIAGIEIAADRAETIAPRLEAVLDALDELPSDTLASVEPAITFAPYEAAAIEAAHE